MTDKILQNPDLENQLLDALSLVNIHIECFVGIDSKPVIDIELDSSSDLEFVLKTLQNLNYLNENSYLFILFDKQDRHESDAQKIAQHYNLKYQTVTWLKLTSPMHGALLSQNRLPQYDTSRLLKIRSNFYPPAIKDFELEAEISLLSTMPNSDAIKDAIADRSLEVFGCDPFQSRYHSSLEVNYHNFIVLHRANQVLSCVQFLNNKLTYFMNISSDRGAGSCLLNYAVSYLLNTYDFESIYANFSIPNTQKELERQKGFGIFAAIQIPHHQIDPNGFNLGVELLVQTDPKTGQKCMVPNSMLRVRFPRR